jgi:type IV secretion system protein TrbF
MAIRSIFPKDNPDMFKRPAVHYGRTPAPVTPYQKAAQVWDDRIGSARAQARNWRLMAFGCLALTAGFAAALIVQSTRGTVIPYVVEVGLSGAVQRVASAVADYQPTDPQIAFHLARFIEDVRGLPADGIVLRQNWLRAYDFTTDRGAAALNDYARTNDPFAKLGTAQVSVEVSSVIRASPESFRIAWVERRYDNGALSATERWTAIVAVKIAMPATADRLRKNPLGVYVHAINWSKELSQ